MRAATDPELTVAEMTAAIRTQLANRRQNPTVRLNLAENSPRVLLEPRVDWHQLFSGIKQAEEHANVGRTVPTLRRLPSPLRQVARLVARGLLLATRFITNRQRSYNQTMLDNMNSLFGLLRYLEQVNRENQRRLDAELQRINLRLDHLEAERLGRAG